MPASGSEVPAPRVGVFVTCLVDLFRPNVGFATLKLLENAGCNVFVPAMQTCCGQPAYNSGANADAREIAMQVIREFERFDYVVAPSGSCIGMIKVHYPKLFDNDPVWGPRAAALAPRCHELMSFLNDVLGDSARTVVTATYPGKVTYHDSCSGLRELEVYRQPRALLAGVTGLELAEMQDSNVCCGFGGTFCVKYPAISERLVSDKTACVGASGADAVLGGDLGCLLNIAGRLKREASEVKVYHAAEVLAGMTDVPAIGEDD
ncbi:MAG: (Fe-S)-binding protein [Gammaproteobacteria bacterium]